VFNFYLSVQALGAPGAEAIADFGDTGLVEGIGLYDASGDLVEGTTFSFASGASYALGPAHVPEPGAAALLLAALAALVASRAVA